MGIAKVMSSKDVNSMVFTYIVKKELSNQGKTGRDLIGVAMNKLGADIVGSG
jgi:hypothetical protein